VPSALLLHLVGHSFFIEKRSSKVEKRSKNNHGCIAVLYNRSVYFFSEFALDNEIFRIRNKDFPTAVAGNGT
jgi:hypothetical protein